MRQRRFEWIRFLGIDAEMAAIYETLPLSLDISNYENSLRFKIADAFRVLDTVTLALVDGPK